MSVHLAYAFKKALGASCVMLSLHSMLQLDGALMESCL